MEYRFESDEFTKWDLLEYMKRAFGAQVNGQPFGIRTVDGWIRLEKIPDAYGGHRVLKVARYSELGDLTVLTIEHLNREDIEHAFGALDKFQRTLNNRRAVEPRVKKKKQRTALYYQMLGSKGKKLTAIPDNYRELGIKENQFKSKQ